MLIRLKPAPGTERSVTLWEQALRGQANPVIGRVQDEALVLDMRTVEPGEEDDLVASVAGSL